MINDDFKKFAVTTQLDNICKILGAEAKHYICSDKKNNHKRIVIDYDHSSNLQ